MESAVYVAHQPILDRNLEIVAHELLFRSGNTPTAVFADHLVASASVISRAVSDFGLEQLLGAKPGFINVSHELLLSDMIELLPPERIILELLESVPVTAAVLERCQKLKALGYQLALDDFVYTPAHEQLLAVVDWVKIDVLQTDPARLSDLLGRLARWPKLRRLAEKVETQADFTRYCELGFDFFQGYHFARPIVSARRRIDPSRVALFKILEQIEEDEGFRTIEETFKEHPDLSIKLLRVIKSIAPVGVQDIDNIYTALTLLGTRQLRNWVLLLLYSENTGKRPGALMQVAAQRGKLMELLVRAKYHGAAMEDFSGAAFMVGVLSLLDAMLSIPFSEITAHLSLSEDIQQALFYRQGILGQLLDIVIAIEHDAFIEVRQLGTALDISIGTIAQSHMQARLWGEHLADVLAG